MIKRIEGWFIDTIKGAAGAIVATLLLALLQYIWGHLPELWQFLGQIVAATSTIKLTRR